eukprot:6178945-Pleurochrysis_carterae.AAC.2
MISSTRGRISQTFAAVSTPSTLLAEPKCKAESGIQRMLAMPEPCGPMATLADPKMLACVATGITLPSLPLPSKTTRRADEPIETSSILRRTSASTSRSCEASISRPCWISGDARRE